MKTNIAETFALNTDSQSFFLEVLDGLTTAVIWVNDEKKVGFINLAAGEIFKKSNRQVMGCSWQALMPGLVEELTDSKTVTVHEYDLLNPGLERVRVSCTVSPYAMSQQKGWLFEIYNTERHHRIVEEDERWHQYEAGNLLVKTLAHEVKNPLAGILGAAQLLQKKQHKTDKEQRFLEIIVNEVKRLKGLVDRMLGPKNKANKEPHNIHELIRYVLEVVASEKPDKVSITLDYDPSIPDILMDFDAMVQAILNLVQNALQAMTNTGGFLTIKTRIEHKFTLGAKTYPLVAMVSIKDEGEGIPPEVFDSMFYPMVTSKSEGTGLGLSVSQNVLRQHKGLIVAESAPGNTVFTIYLPLSQ